MDLDLPADQALLRDTTARFIEATCPLDAVRALADERDASVAPSYVRQAGEIGWFSLLVPEEHGGGSVSGAGLLDAAVVALERGRLLQPGPFVPVNVVAWALATAGSEDQRAKVLPGLTAGETTAGWAVADPAGGWDAGAGVTATPSGDGFASPAPRGWCRTRIWSTGCW